MCPPFFHPFSVEIHPQNAKQNLQKSILVDEKHFNLMFCQSSIQSKSLIQPIRIAIGVIYVSGILVCQFVAINE